MLNSAVNSYQLGITSKEPTSIAHLACRNFTSKRDKPYFWSQSLRILVSLFLHEHNCCTTKLFFCITSNSDSVFSILQSTAPSHRVGSNVQNVIAMMKGHNPELCAAAGTAHPRPRSAPPRVKRGGGNKQKLIVSETATDHSEDEHDIQDMMDQLTEEYTHMSA